MLASESKIIILHKKHSRLKTIVRDHKNNNSYFLLISGRHPLAPLKNL